MFHLSDYAMAARDLAIFESGATIDKHGQILFDNENRDHTRSARYNACDIFLQWECGPNFGVQRVRVGKTKAESAASWRKWLQGLDKKTGTDRLTAYAADRAVKVESVFAGESVAFEVLGWRLVNATFWTPGSAIKIPAAKEAVIRFYSDTPNATPHIPTTLAKVSNGKSEK